MNIAMLMVDQVPYIFKDFTVTTVEVACPIFQEELSGLLSKGMESIHGESVWVSCKGNLTFTCITLIAYCITELASFILSFQGTYWIIVVF